MTKNLCILILTALFLSTLSSNVFSQSLALKKTTVVLDAGHGPKSPGSLSFSGIQEYTQTLKIRQELAALLKKEGFHVLLTDQQSSLSARAGLQGHLFLSIHYDSVPSVLRAKNIGDTIFGYSTFVSRKNNSYQKSVSCARSISWGMQHAGEKPSLFHQKGLGGKEPRPLIDTRLGVHRFDDLIVLKMSKNPAVLLEIGMWINRYDEPRLLQGDVIKNQARGIAAGIKQCLT